MLNCSEVLVLWWWREIIISVKLAKGLDLPHRLAGISRLLCVLFFDGEQQIKGQRFLVLWSFLCIKGSQYCFLPTFPTSCYYKCMHLWETYTYISFFHSIFVVFHSFFILFIFAVMVLESQDKPLFSWNKVPEEEIKFAKTSYVSFCLCRKALMLVSSHRCWSQYQKEDICWSANRTAGSSWTDCFN